MNDERGGNADRLPDHPRGLFKVTTENATEFFFRFTDGDTTWMRVPAEHPDGTINSSGADRRWLRLAWRPYLTDWSTGKSEPVYLNGDRFEPAFGIRVGYGMWLGQGVFSDHWWSTEVTTIEPADLSDLPRAALRRLRQRHLRWPQAALDDRPVAREE